MFTGIVTDIGTLLSAEFQGKGIRRMRIGCAYPVEDIALGASIACAGVCLTVVATGREAGQGWFEIDASVETLNLTTLSRWQPGQRMNLERALKIGDELGGHIVTGHVDGVARIVARKDFDGMAHFEIQAPHDLAKFIAAKGSAALDGTSLTVNEVSGDRFTILLIPHTLAVTTWGDKGGGDPLNIEVDLMARYAARLIEAR